MVTSPAFKHWEIKDSIYKLKFDVQSLENDPEISLVEDIHKAVFRNGLENSLYSPSYMIGAHTCSMLHKFHEKHFNVSNTALIGVGLNHELLENLAYKYFSHYKSNESATAKMPPVLLADENGNNKDLINNNNQIDIRKPSKSFFPGESRVFTNDPLTYALLVTEGGSLMNTKDMLSLALLQNIMGVGPHIKYGSIQTSGRLAKHCLNRRMNPILTPFAISCYNANYTDTGLFGVYIISQPQFMDRLLRCAIDCFRDIGGRNGISSEELVHAKTHLKASYLMSMEDSSVFLEDLMLQTLMTHQVSGPKQILAAIDEISMEDVSKVAKRLITKCGLAVRGNLKNTPHLDELMN